MMRKLTWTLLIAIFVLSGCASEIRVTQMSNDLKPWDTVDGVPFRVPKRFKAQVYEKRDKGYEKVGNEQLFTIPDPDRVYVLNFKSQVLSNATVDLAFNSDNTIQQVSLKSQSMFAGALTAAGTQLNTLAKEQQAKEQGEKTAATSSASTSITADKAKQAAQLASLQYQLLQANPNVSAEDLLKAKLKERSAKLDANEAARLAGKDAYYPDVLP